jgi:hypothetical protein
MFTPIRRPDFAAIYPTERAFEEARSDFESAVAAEPVGQPPTAIESLDLAKIRRDALPRGFSLRVLAHEALESADPQIVSEHEGRISELLLTIPKHSDSAGNAVDPLHARHFKAILAAFGADVRFVIVAAPNQKRDVESWFDEASIPADKLAFVSSPRFRYTIWAQDAYVALRDKSGGKILCEGISFPRGEDMTIADDIAAQTDVSAMQSYLYFQGGNVLGGHKLTLMGVDYVWRNSTRFSLHTMADATASLERLFGTSILALGGQKSARGDLLRAGVLSGYGFQPIFHIDMYVTPTGVAGASGKEVVFLARPRKAREITGHFSDVSELDNPTYDRFFEETADQLASRFEVRELPLWLTFGNLGGAAPEAKFYNLTWNNAVVENAGSIRRVLLPAYSQDSTEYGVDMKLRQELEAASAAEWEALGFEVTFMDGLEDLAWGDGSVHCITKTLVRTA